MLIVRQSTARTVTVGPVLDATGVAVTDCVVGDFKASKNGGAPAALNGSATLTHRATGHYSLALTASDLDTVGQAEIVLDDGTNACGVKEITVVEEAVYDALFTSGATGYLTPTAGSINRAMFAADTGLQTIRSGTVPSAGDALGINLDAGASAVDEFYTGCAVYLTGGTGAGQSRAITTYSGTFKNASVYPAWVTEPDATTTFAILPSPSAIVESGRVWSYVESMGGNAITASAIATNAITSAKIATGTITAAKFGAAAITATVAPNLDAAVSTRATQTSVDDLPTNAELSSALAALAALIGDSVLDEVVEGSMTLRQITRVLLSSAALKLSGASGTTVSIRDLADSKDRIVATVDEDGNRTAVTLDGT